ncbi:MAG: 50S ribosomal protein L15 [Rickettsiales bacterium]|jgi:large subunit ribosomal protein L15|nr:50S ribosomal protein L15 [Rickettsiales bacterium]
MQLNAIRDNKGAAHRKMRVGRGIGSGKGKTAGRGNKGQKSRSGVSIRWFEGGQSPLYRRLPKRGFNNADFRKEYAVVNLGKIQELVDAKLVKDRVDAKILRALKVIDSVKDGLKVLAKGELKAPVAIEAAVFSKAARTAVEKAGGKAVEPAKSAAPKGKKAKLAKKEKTSRIAKKKAGKKPVAVAGQKE